MNNSGINPKVGDFMKDLTEVIDEIKEICKTHPVMQERIEALKHIGYENIEYRYLKSSLVLITSNYNGLLSARHLPKKKLYRIQIGYAELQKGYPAAWCIDVSSQDVKYVQELPY
jgi:hypothetical protein